MAKRERAVDLCVCQEGLPIAESILLEFRDRLARGLETASSTTEMTVLWGAYLGEVVRIEHGDAVWQNAAGAPTSHSWIRFHGPGSRERFEPFAAADAILREQGPRTPLAVTLGLRILDCHLE